MGPFRQWPTGQGFDVDRQPKEIGFEKDAYHDDSGRYLTDAFAEEGISFIEQNRRKPWFLYFAPHAVHAPFDPPYRPVLQGKQANMLVQPINKQS